VIRQGWLQPEHIDIKYILSSWQLKRWVPEWKGERRGEVLGIRGTLLLFGVFAKKRVFIFAF